MIGRQVSRFRILDRLGAGGMGEVYLAEDQDLKRKVAIKFLVREMASDPAALARFRHEAQNAAELSHPGINALLEFGTYEGQPFLVLEYVPGETLSARIARGPIPVEQVLSIGRLMAEALAYSHGRKIIHRDIKSTNVMLTPDGGVRILDLGLSRKPGATRITESGVNPGTIAYMSPEQMSGDPADERSDIWSLGVVLYECLIGRLPFEAESVVGTMNKVMSEDAIPPINIRRGIPAGLSQVVERCLQKDPAIRFQHVDEVAAQLRLFESHVRVPVMPRPSQVSSVLSIRSRPWLWLIASLPVIVVLLFLLLSHWGSAPGTPPTEVVRPNTIAMMDFENLTGDVAFDWIGRGLPELLSTALARSRDLDVYDPQRLSNLLQTPGSADILGAPGFKQLRDHGVTRAIVGSILRSGADIRIQCRIVDTASGRVLHSDVISGSASDDLFHLAGELIPKLQTWLEIDLVAVGSEDRWLRDITTSSSDAYRLYLRTHEALIALRWRQAAGYGEQAVALDSQFVSARVDLVGSYWNLGDMAHMLENLTALRRLRPRASTRDALQIDVITAVVSGSAEQLIGAASAAHELYPENRFFTYLLGRGYHLAGRFERCLEVLEPLMKERYSWGWTYILAARSYEKLGRMEDCQRCLETGMEVTNHNPEIAIEYARFLLAAGDSTAARGILVGAERSPNLVETPEVESLIRLQLARIYEAEGKADSARFQYQRVLTALLPPDAADDAQVEWKEHLIDAREGLKRLSSRK